jgi:hypothetical protein
VSSFEFNPLAALSGALVVVVGSVRGLVFLPDSFKVGVGEVVFDHGTLLSSRIPSTTDDTDTVFPAAFVRALASFLSHRMFFSARLTQMRNLVFMWHDPTAAPTPAARKSSY